MPSTVTGNVRNLLATVTAGATVRFWLRGLRGNQPRITATGAIAPQNTGSQYYVDLVSDASGNVSGSIYSTRDAAGTGAGDIEAGGSKTAVWYGMQLLNAGAVGPEVPIHAKNGVTLDISSVTPITIPPVSVAPTGDTTYLRLDGGNSPVTGSTTFSPGGIVAPTATLAKLNNVFLVDGTTYATVSAAITAAMAAGGGRVEVPAGSYDITNSTKLVLGDGTKNIHLHLHENAVINVKVTDGGYPIIIHSGSKISGDGFGADAYGGSNWSSIILVDATANIQSVLTNAEQDGSTYPFPLEGVAIRGKSGSTVDVALVDFVGASSGMHLRDVRIDWAYGKGLYWRPPGEPIWRASKPYFVGQVVDPTTPNGHYYKCTTAGTSAGSEPSWPTGSGATVVDGGVTWTEVTITKTADVTVLENVIVAGAPAGTAAAPVTFESAKTGNMAHFVFFGLDAENVGTSKACITLTGNGGAGLENFRFYGTKLEAGATATGIGFNLTDVSNILIDGAHGQDGGQDLIKISQTGGGKATIGVEIRAAYSNSWTNLINDTINSYTIAKNAGGFAGVSRYDVATGSQGLWRMFNAGTGSLGDTTTEHLNIDWSGNVARIYTNKSGTGTVRSLGILTMGAATLWLGSNSVSQWGIDSTGKLTLANGKAYIASDGTVYAANGASSIDNSGKGTFAGVVSTAATPTVAASQLGLGTTSGFGNGTAGQAVTTTLKNTGTGPTTATTVVNYLKVNIGGTDYWIALFQ